VIGVENPDKFTSMKNSVPMATTDAYSILQRRLLPYAERCSWWMGQLCNSEWSVEEAVMEAIQMLGILYSDRGRLVEAEAMYQRALEGKEKALGRDHTSTLRTVNSLSLLYSKQGRLEEAEAMCQRALQGRGEQRIQPAILCNDSCTALPTEALVLSTRSCPSYA